MRYSFNINHTTGEANNRRKICFSWQTVELDLQMLWLEGLLLVLEDRPLKGVSIGRE